MSLPLRPRRSVLYMPGANARALDKARTLPADALILAGRGVVLVNGRLVEQLHVDEAERMLAIAEAIARNATAA